MNYNFDPTQETHEEYLRRIHAEDKLNMEWKNDQEEEKEKHNRFRSRCWPRFRKF